MLKASTLYVVIVIALIIAMLCSSIILAAYFYKEQYQKKFRYDVLHNNLNSGVNILIAGQDSSYFDEKTISLFNNDIDSIKVKRVFWGLYDVAVVKAFIQKDTLYKAFSVANNIDSAKWAALYLIDEDRPLSVSGNTMIKGDAFIPKAGVKEAYVDNKAYSGDKRLVIGNKRNSAKKLPLLQQNRIDAFERLINQTHKTDSTFLKRDSIRASFLTDTRSVSFKKTVQILKNINLSGNIILFSDTTFIIDSTAVLNNIMVFARTIKVMSGFHGTCQLFASDSISVANNCRFDYPSCLGILRFKPPAINSQAKISLGDKSTFSGLVFTYEKNEGGFKSMIHLGKSVKIEGQVYAQGILEIKDNDVVNGSIFTSRFSYQNSFTRFENYLINLTINSKALSPYYLTSGLMPVKGKRKKVLQWLEAN